MVVGCSGGTVVPPTESGVDAANVIDAADGAGGSSGSGGAAGSDGASDDVIDDEGSCVTEFYEGKPLPVDIYILADSSEATADCPTLNPCPSDGGVGPPNETRWSTVMHAIDTFAKDPGAGVGLGFFPRFSGGGNAVSCLVDDYAVPDLPFGSQSSSFTAALEAQIPRGGWLLAEPLGGALRYAATRAKANPGRQSLVAIITHGSETNVCNDDAFAGAIEMAAAALASTPPVKTTVISLTPSLVRLYDVSYAGGTFSYGVNTSPDRRGEMLARLREASTPCDYPIPDTPDASRTLRALFLETRIGFLGAFSAIAQRDDAAHCSSPGGWFYNDNMNPSRVSLCPQTCRAVAMTAGSAIRLGVGCSD